MMIMALLILLCDLLLLFVTIFFFVVVVVVVVVAAAAADVSTSLVLSSIDMIRLLGGGFARSARRGFYCARTVP